jgi:energy-coupling factor transport system permease protein
VIALTTTNPLYGAIVVLAVAMVALVAPSAPERSSLRAFLGLGIGVVLFSGFVSLANGTPGDSTLFSVPGPTAPGWLGGLRFGGPVTSEGLVIAGTRALGILAVFAAFSVVTMAMSPGRLLRATPAVLAEAGIVVTVGLALLPATIEDLRRLREAERLRGREVRWWRMPGLVTPAMLSGLERSVHLAEALEARGLREAPGARPSRLAGAASAPLGLAGAYLWMSGGTARLLAPLAAGAAAAAAAWWLVSAARVHRTTRLHEEPSRRSTAIAALLALVAAGFVLGGSKLGVNLGYNPLLDGLLPPFNVPGAILALLPAWPFAPLVLAPAGREGAR